MIKSKFLFLLGTLLLHFIVSAQDPVFDSLSTVIAGAAQDSAKVKAMNQLSQHVGETDLQEAIAINKQAEELAVSIGYEAGVAQANRLMGINYYFLAEYANALTAWNKAKVIYQKQNNKTGEAGILSNMGAIYHNQSEYVKAMELYEQAMQIAYEEGDTFRIGTVLQNIGAIHVENGDDQRALDSYLEAKALFEEIDYQEGLALTLINIGDIHLTAKAYDLCMDHFNRALSLMPVTSPYYSGLLRNIGVVSLETKGFDQAMVYLDSAYNIALDDNDDFEVPRILNSIAKAYESKGDVSKALEYFEKAKIFLIEANEWNRELEMVAKGLVRLYSGQGDYEKAFENQQLFQSVKDSIYSLESDKKIDQMLFNIDLDKKENEIALLVKDNEIQEIEVERQKGIRNGFIAGFILMLVFTVIFFMQRNRINKEKDRSDSLLRNILPNEVAEELMETGASDAKLIDQVTVLFTDFQGFAALSEQLSPKDLVADLHACFSEFDRISEKYGIEKIKTIGDAYMAAGGLPVPNSTHATDVVNASLEMVAFVESEKAAKQAAGKPFFQIRVGVHTGPVVAGIVGVKKFQYDIWGDTVNTASRMESSGEVGKVNISAATYSLLQNSQHFAFESRGNIEVKGKGEMEMWFVETL